MVKEVEQLFEVGTLPELGTIPKKMHAWTLREENMGEPVNAFKQEIVDVPKPRKGEVIVAIMSAGLNYNGIWAASGKPKNVIAANGNYDDEKEDFHICGSEASGIIYDVGEGVTQLKIGDHVTVGASQYDENCEIIRAGADPVCSPTFRVWGYEGNWGAFAQFSRVKAYQCAGIPDNMNWAEASALTAAGVPAYRMLTHWEGNKVKKGDVVLVYGGAGGVGSMAIQLAAYFGAVPIAVVSNEKRGQLCMKLGAKGYIDRTKYHHWGRLDGYLDSKQQKKWMIEAMKFRKNIWEIAGEKKSPAIVIEHPGMDTMPTSLFVCDTKGMVVTCGATSSYLADFDLRFLWLNQKRIQGSHSATPEDSKGFFDVIQKSGIKPYIGQTFAWDQLAYAHQLLYEGKQVDGKITINIGIKE